MFYEVIITDSIGNEVFTETVEAENLLIAGVKAEDIFDLYHLYHQCKHCKHNCRVNFIKMKGGL